jgi:tetratricopeptide (TPR) repeat protein
VTDVRGWFWCLCTAVAAVPAAAQCPDGTPPPCAGQRPPPLNPDRIAILPFRVTAADTLLGQGMAELLAPEFTGETGPLAVNMATVLRVWRRAGGSARTPLEPAAAQRVARAIGAGRLIDGTIVSLGTNITLSASVVNVPGGRARRVGPLTGPVDSLPSLVGRLASGLLGQVGGTPLDLQIRLTDSPAAMRAYVEGMARQRLGDFDGAATAFERALAFDSLFARAALMRFLSNLWRGMDASEGGWDRVLWQLRSRLSARDRVLVNGLVGDTLGAWITPAARVAQLRRAAQLLPESPEAQFWLGDHLFHFGSATDVADDFAAARAQLELARRMDPQFEMHIHLLDIGFYTGDTSLVRGIWTEFERTSVPGFATAYGRLAAHVLGDTVLATRYSGQANPFFLQNGVTLALLPANEVARLFGEPAPITDAVRLTYLRLTAVNTGRLALLPDTTVDDWRGRQAAAALRLSGDSTIASAAAVLSAYWAAILSGHARSGAGHRTREANDAVMQALRSRRPDLRAKTMHLDSIVRWSVANEDRSGAVGYEGLLLSAAWEASGDPARALAAVHLLDIFTLNTVYLLAPELRREGRLAAQLGDTTRAIRAYRRYLMLRRDADPALISERDSVAAALARLERR